MIIKLINNLNATSALHDTDDKARLYNHNTSNHVIT